MLNDQKLIQNQIRNKPRMFLAAFVCVASWDFTWNTTAATCVVYTVDVVRPYSPIGHSLKTAAQS